jgi:hypothetical protein
VGIDAAAQKALIREEQDVCKVVDLVLDEVKTRKGREAVAESVEQLGRIQKALVAEYRDV